MDWWTNLTDQQVTLVKVVVGVVTSLGGGVFAVVKYKSKKSSATSKDSNTIEQTGVGHTALVAPGNSGTIVVGDQNIGIDSEKALEHIAKVNREARSLETEIENHKETIVQLKQALVEARSTLDQAPTPSPEAEALAEQITKDDSPYAQALKAITQKDFAQAEIQLNHTQHILDQNQTQLKQNYTQAEVYMARIQNARYAGKPAETLGWCEMLEPFTDKDAVMLNDLGLVYLDCAQYEKAEPMMERALAIDEASYGKDHPNVAIRLNNLAQLYKATNRLEEAEPLMDRALAINEATYDKDHPAVANSLNNLAQLYKATNRLKEAEPLMDRALSLFIISLGEDHPTTITVRENLATLREVM